MRCPRDGRHLRSPYTPGPVDTPPAAAATGDPAISAYIEGLIPMGRRGRAAEVAQAIQIMGSDASSFITGAEITVDAG